MTKKFGVFMKIESREDAEYVAKSCSTAFFAVAVLQGAVSFIVDPSMMIDAVLFVICGYFVRAKHSRAAAVILLVLCSIGLVTTFLAKIGAMTGGKNIGLAILITLAAARAVEATYKLNGRFRDGAAAQGLPSAAP